MKMPSQKHKINIVNLNLIKRIFSSIVLIAILFFTFIYGTLPIFFLCTFVFGRALYELNTINKENKKIKLFLFIGNLFLFLTYLLYSYSIFFNSLNLIFITTIIASLHDIGGYIFGNLFGRIKISKNISPKKTLEGLTGSFIFILYGVEIMNFLYFTNPIRSILGCILFTLVAFLGDLFFSKIKRLAKVKDYEYMIPGHGGILDRIDSSIFLAWYVKYIFFTC